VVGDPDVAGAVLFGTSSVRMGELEVAALGVDPLRGGLGPRVLRGRLPSGPDEVALGATTARDLGVSPGDPIEVEGPAGATTARVSGLVVVPGVGFGPGLGTGAVLTFDGLSALDPFVSRSLVAVTLRQGADREAALARLEQALASQPDTTSVPADIRNLDRLAAVPWLLAAVLAVLAAVVLVHSLLASVRCRRRDLAVLRTFGACRGWVARAVHWQATTLVVVPLLAAIPLGIVAGRTVFRALAGRMGAVDEPVTGVGPALAVAVGAVVLANLVALWPGLRARRTRPVELLRPE
jgi:predicted lysophospholipase L1 biosynthesis ABC-type transport system permease subunit